ncbi:hypothetical protein D083_1956 [Dickeya solani RNS 08.23.3.1.A]|nr:hypothetical protein D083_1956 [Dickeya solani RNS 08.23.3.1.A]
MPDISAISSFYLTDNPEMISKRDIKKYIFKREMNERE